MYPGQVVVKDAGEEEGEVDVVDVEEGAEEEGEEGMWLVRAVIRRRRMRRGEKRRVRVVARITIGETSERRRWLGEGFRGDRLRDDGVVATRAI